MITWQYIATQSEQQTIQGASVYTFQIHTRDKRFATNTSRPWIVNVRVMMEQIGGVWRGTVDFGQDEMLKCCFVQESSMEVASSLVNTAAMLIRMDIEEIV